MISRRSFLGVLVGAATAVVVPELIVSKRTFFLPPLGGWVNPIPFIPFREPDPALFKMLEEIQHAADEMTGPYTSMDPARGDDITVVTTHWRGRDGTFYVTDQWPDKTFVSLDLPPLKLTRVTETEVLKMAPDRWPHLLVRPA